MTLPARVLVTGGAGFIGRRLVERLAAADVTVCVVDNEMVGRPLPPASPRVHPHRADIRDAAAFARILAEAKPESIVHLAALHHIPTCEREPARAVDINITGTQVVLDSAAQAGVMQVLLASSGAVYTFHDGPLIEDETPLGVSDVYSLCKLTNESQVRLWAARSGGRAQLARIFNVIGHDDPNGHIIPDILAQLRDPQAREVRLGNTTPRRDYTHADDTADALLALLRTRAAGREVEAYNVSFGAEYSVTDLVDAIAQTLGRQVTIGLDPARLRKVDRLSLLGDTRKMQATTGWHAQRPFAAAVRDIVERMR